ncbi:MAG: peptidoglycan-binding protein [Cyanobacteria bacterium J06632_3]
MWSRTVTMKQPVVRILRLGGLGVAMMSLIQLPTLASNRMPTNLAPQSGESSVIVGSSVESSTTEPQLLAVALNNRSLRQGDQGADVRILQRYLSRNGLYPYVIDGVYGPETANAVATYQRIRDLPATGVADESTLIDMDFDFLPQSSFGTNSAGGFSTSSSSSTSLQSGGLGPGSTGNDVVALQQRLNDFGIPVIVDGVYGFETQQGVRTYQRVQGLNVTGNADSDTLASMGFSAPRNRYIAAVIAGESELEDVRAFFGDAYIDRARQGRFINIGNFNERSPAEARVDAAAARGFNTRVIYRRSNLLF